jgi:putative OPT family oligopeptide transporter
MNTVPQLSPRAVILSVVLTMLLAAANAYLGLFAGLTVATAIPAAVVSMGVLRVLGRSGILENNIVATGASAGASVAAGTVFTLPALVVLGHWQHFPYLWVLTIVGLGGVLGVLFSVPLRRTLILEQNLKFPEGLAAAEVLKAGADPGRGVRLLARAGAVAALIKLVVSGLRLVPETWAVAARLGNAPVVTSLQLSPALIAVGYIVGANIGCVMIAGGLIAWWVLIPIFAVMLPASDAGLAAQLAGLSPADAAGLLWSTRIRYVGVGAMLTGGLWSLWTLRGSLLSGVSSGLRAARTSRREVIDTERDLPMQLVLGGIVLFVLPLFALYVTVVGSIGVAAAMALIMVVAGFVFSSVSGYMAGLVGSSNNPVSGITISTILFASLVLLFFLGHGSAVGPVAAILIGAVTCTAAAVAGDNLQDLKAGQLVGATPWRQQVMLVIGALVSAAVMAPVLNLLLEAYGIGTPAHPGAHPLQAPQAHLMAAVAHGIFEGGLPWDMVGLGATIGALVIALDQSLARRGAACRAPVLAVAVGIYLPLEYTSPIFVGGMLAALADRWLIARHGRAPLERLRQTGLLLAAGLIAGEALVGVLIAIPIVAAGDADVLALPQRLQFGVWPGLLLIALLSFWVYRTATREARAVSKP